MKNILMTLFIILMGSFAASAQQDDGSIQDKIQQEPPRETQTAVDRAARQANINEQNNQNVKSAQDQLDAAKERATGKESKNPAASNPTTVKPPAISDPVSAPVNSGNR